MSFLENGEVIPNDVVGFRSLLNQSDEDGKIIIPVKWLNDLLDEIEHLRKRAEKKVERDQTNAAATQWMRYEHGSPFSPGFGEWCLWSFVYDGSRNYFTGTLNVRDGGKMYIHCGPFTFYLSEIHNVHFARVIFMVDERKHLLKSGDFVRIRDDHESLNRRGVDGMVHQVLDEGIGIIFGCDRHGKSLDTNSVGVEYFNFDELDMETVQR